MADRQRRLLSVSTLKRSKKRMIFMLRIRHFIVAVNENLSQNKTRLHRAGTDGKWEVWEVLCVEVDVEDTRRIGGGLIALNEYVDVAVGIHVDVLGRRLKRLISLGSAVLRLREAAV